MPHTKPTLLHTLTSKRMITLYVGIVAILGMVSFIYFHQASPGDLSRAHDAVAGSSFIMDCKKCHTSQGLTSGCLQCHSEIQQQLTRRTGYHFFLLNKKKVECARCHSDHNGKDFALVNKVSWEGKDFRTFTHPHVKFKLTDAHVKLDCAQCHAAKDSPPFALPKFPKHKRKMTYLRLSQDCVSCHADPHAQGRASDCTSCHDQKRWRPAPKFNHDKWYPLRGGHAGLACSQCHLPPKKGMTSHSVRRVVFGPTKGKRCIDCHTSPHFTKWVESCQACHQRDDLHWKLADKRMTKKQHSLTGFRLIVPHHKTQCVECHGPDLPGIPYKVRYPNPRLPGYKRFEKNCEACHRDEHRGQFIKNHPRCIECHALKGFKPNTYTVEDHITYSLVGGHLKAACNSCHLKDSRTKVRQYVPTPKACAVCHKDIHFGQFRKPNGTTRCEDCHLSNVTWKKLVFNHNTQSRFKLDEAHRNVACKECHPMVRLSNNIRIVQYKPIRRQCKDCHELEGM